MPDVLAIMPCRGRAAQTVEAVRRLLETAGAGVDWELICYVDRDREVFEVLRAAQVLPESQVQFGAQGGGGYWHALASVTAQRPEVPILCNLANDLLPGHDWLQRGLAAYRRRFGDRAALVGFNDGIHGPGLAPHFLIGRSLLEYLGGWPLQYQHNFGDAELCARAQTLGIYTKAPWAVLYHNHPGTGNVSDAVYTEGRATRDADEALFYARRRAGWPATA